MSCCPPPCCVTPSCCPSPCCSPCYPRGGLGSLCCPSPCCSSPCCSPSCCGSTSASCLGIVPGVTPSCVNQIPSSEVVVQPAPFCVTIPGPILAASCEPVRVGGYTACGGSCCPPCGKIC